MPNSLKRVLPKRKPGDPHLAKNPHRVVQYSVVDGGIIEPVDRYFLVYTDEFVGKFRNLKNAVRAAEKSA